MEIQPIRTEQDYKKALSLIENLWGARSGTRAFDELDIITTLVEQYERQNHAIDFPEPVAAIRFRMEQQGLSRKDLEGIIGHRARISEVLSGARRLSLNMIQKLHSELGIRLTF